METNYTLKKLIRGGTVLLFFLAFMLSGPMTGQAQNRTETDVTVTLDGDLDFVQHVKIEWDGPGSPRFVASTGNVSIPKNYLVTFTLTYEEVGCVTFTGFSGMSGGWNTPTYAGGNTYTTTTTFSETHAITFNFQNFDFLLTAEVDDIAMGTVSLPGITPAGLVTDTFECEETVIVTATRSGTYVFNQWTYSDPVTATDGSFNNNINPKTAFAMPGQEITVTANFVQGYDLTGVVTPTNGSLTMNPAVGAAVNAGETKPVGEGVSVEIVAIASAGWTLSNIETNNGDVNSDLSFAQLEDGTVTNTFTGTFSMPDSDLVVTATFVQYEITGVVTPTGEGTLTFNGGSGGPTTGGSNVEIVAIASAGWTLSNIETNNVDVNSDLSFAQLEDGTVTNTFTSAFEMPYGDLVVTATFVQYEIAGVVTPTGEGTLTFNGGSGGPTTGGSNVEIVAIASAGWTLSNIETNNVDVNSDLSFAQPEDGTVTNTFTESFEMPYDDLVVTATFVRYEITGTATPTGSLTFNGGSGGPTTGGSDVELVATAAAGWTVDKVEFSDVAVHGNFQNAFNGTHTNTYTTTFAMPYGDLVVTATFIKTEVTVVQIGEGGKVEVNDNIVTNSVGTETVGVTLDTEAVVVATANSNWTIESFESSSGTVDFDYDVSTVTFTMTAAEVVTVTFKRFVIEAAVDGAGTIDPAGTTPKRSGVEVDVVATPDPGYMITGWTVSGTLEPTPAVNSGLATFTFTMPTNNVEVTAKFEPFNLAVVPGTGSGTISITDPASNDPMDVNVGDLVEVTAVAEAGWTIQNIQVTGGTVSDFISPGTTDYGTRTATFTMPAGNVTITANFVEYILTTDVSPAAGTAYIGETGTVTQTRVRAGDVEYIRASVVSVGYTFDEWTPATGIADVNEATTTFTMTTSDATVTANFKRADFNVIVSVVGEGNVTGDLSVGLNTETFEDVLNFTADPDTDWKFKEWQVTGATLDSDDDQATNSFTMPAETVNLTAVFEPAKPVVIFGDDEICLEAGKDPYMISEFTVGSETNLDFEFYEWTLSTGAGVFMDGSGTTATATVKWNTITENKDVWIQVRVWEGPKNTTPAIDSEEFDVKLFVAIENILATVVDPVICPGEEAEFNFAIEPQGAEDGVFGAFGTSTLTKIAGPGTATVTVTKGGDGQFFVKANDYGVYTLTYSASNGICGPVTETVSFKVDQIQLTGVDIDTPALAEACVFTGFTFNATPTGLTTPTYLWAIEGIDPGYYTASDNTLQSFTVTPTKAGVYTVTVTAGDICNHTETDSQVITVYPEPEDLNVVVENNIFDEDIILTASFNIDSPSGVTTVPFTYSLDVVGETWSYTNNYDVTTVSTTIDAGELEVGTYTLTLDVTTYASCTTEQFEKVFTVKPPLRYATFTPAYLYAGTVTPTDVPLETDLTIKFNGPVYTTGGDNLTGVVQENLQEYFKFQIKSSTWVDLDFTVDISGDNEFTINPVEDLVKDARYRILYEDVKYLRPGGDFVNVKWRQDAVSGDAQDGFEFDKNVHTYVDAKFVIFETVKAPTLPTVNPYELLATDAEREVTITFINPIKYRSGLPVANEADLAERFAVLVNDDCDGSGDWQIVEFDTFADFEAIENGDEGPVKITFDFEQEIGKKYRIVVRPNSDGSHGFTDMVTLTDVLVATATSTLEDYVKQEDLDEDGDIIIGDKFAHEDDVDGDFGWYWCVERHVTDIKLAVVEDVDYPILASGQPFSSVLYTNAGGGVVSNTMMFVGNTSETVQIDNIVAAEGQKFVGWTISAEDKPGRSTTTETFIIDQDLIEGLYEPDHGITTITFTAVFEKKQYAISVGLDETKGSFATGDYAVGPATETLTHGDYVYFEIQPVDGQILTGWQFNFAPGSVGVVTNSVTTEFDNTPAHFEFYAIGQHNPGRVFNVTPTFEDLSPAVYAQIKGGVASLTWEVSDADLISYFTNSGDYAGFKEWNMVYGGDLTLIAGEAADCSLVFDRWERSVDGGTTWTTWTEGPLANQLELDGIVISKMFRAVYETAVVLVTIDETTLGDIVVEFDGDEYDAGDELSVPVGETVIVTVTANPNRTVFGWDVEGEPVFGRYGEKLDDDVTHSVTVVHETLRKSVWTLTVGCDDEIVLTPVIERQRRIVEVEVDGVGGTFGQHSPEYVADAYTEYGTGFRFRGNEYDGDIFIAATATDTYGKAYIPRADNFSVKAVPDAGYEFVGWFTAAGVLVTEDDVLAGQVFDAAYKFYAHFEAEELMAKEFELVVLVDEMEGSVAVVNVDDIGVVEFDEEEGIYTIGRPAGVTQTIQLTATAMPGYEFSHWTDIDGVGVATTTNPTTFDVGPDDDLVKVYIGAAFKPQTRGIDIVVRGYQFGEFGLAGFEIVQEDVGTVTATTIHTSVMAEDDVPGTVTGVFGDHIVLEPVAKPGFEFVNFMFKSVIDGRYLYGYQVAENNVYVIPKSADDIIIKAIFREDADAVYPKFDLTVTGEFSDDDELGHPGTYVHGVYVELFVCEDNVTEQGKAINMTDPWAFTPEATDFSQDPFVFIDRNILAEVQYIDVPFVLIVTAIGDGKVSFEGEIDNGDLVYEWKKQIETEYIPETAPIELRAKADDRSPEFVSTFIGWFFDEEGDNPVQQPAGVDVTEPIFFWEPKFPDEGELFEIFALFETVTATYTVELATALDVYTNETEIAVLDGLLEGAGTYEFGTEVDVNALATAAANVGYQFKRWTTVGGTPIVTFPTTDFDHEVVADVKFIAVFTALESPLTLNVYPVEAAGVVTPVGESFITGEVVEIEAAANEGWAFVEWIDAQGEVVSEVPDFDFTMAYNAVLTAKFERTYYTITAEVDGVGGTIDPVGTVTVVAGEDQEFVITPDTGFIIDELSVNGDPVVLEDTDLYGYTLEFEEVMDDYYILVTFAVEMFTITATAGDNGEIDPEGEVLVAYGEDQEFVITPDLGYIIDELLLNGDPVVLEDEDLYGYTLEIEDVTADATVAVTFVIETITITAIPNNVAKGSVTGGDEYEYGDEVTLVATPNTGFKFVHWLEDGEPIVDEDEEFVGATYVFAAEEDRDIIGVFAPIAYTLTLLDVDGGELSATPDKDAYNIFDLVTITATPDAGWEFVPNSFTGLPANAVVVGNVASLVWGNTDLTIGATFIQTTFAFEFMVTFDGDDIEDAVITLGDIVNDEGDYVFEDLLPGTYSFTVAVDGFNDYVGEIEIPADEEYEVVFEQKDAPDADDISTFETAKTAFIQTDAAIVNVAGEDMDDDVDNLFTGLIPGETYEFTVIDTTDEAGYKIESLPFPGEFTTLQLGDVDGNLEIQIQDRLLIIAFMNNNPDALDARIDYAWELADLDENDPRFIFDAADIDGNGAINILDLVKWVNIFNSIQDDKSLQSDAAGIHMDKNIVHLESDGSLAAIQFELTGYNLDNVELSMIASGYELFWNVNGDVLTGFIVSHDNHAFAKGMTELFKIQHADALEWGKVFAANLNGDKVAVDAYDIPTDITETFTSELSVNVYPNPSSGQFTSVVDVPANSKVTLKLYDLSGRELASKEVSISGVEHVSWNEDLNPGMYILRMIATPEGQADLTVTREVRVLIN